MKMHIIYNVVEIYNYYLSEKVYEIVLFILGIELLAIPLIPSLMLGVFI